MTAAFGIGYDWLYDQWTADQRQVLRTAIVELGLQPGLKVYRRTSGGWHTSQHNWNQVCNGGMTIGALAIADEQPQLAGEILEQALRSVPRAMQHFAPDGAWGEGPGYWSYATQYNVAMIAALESALGTDYGLSAIPGFAEAGTFPDLCHRSAGPDVRLCRCPRRHASPAAAVLVRPQVQPARVCRVSRSPMPSRRPMDLVFYEPRGHQFDLATLPLDKYFRESEVGMFRSAWNDRNALWVAFKAGSNAVNHSHLDLGTFVLEALGERWFVDLGSDDYNLPGYFGSQRWDYYRLRAEGHNTLVINPGQGPDQDPRAATKIVRFQAAGDAGSRSAVLDLTPAYAAHATKVLRTISMQDRRWVTIRDELETKAPADVWSMLHTPATIDLERRRPHRDAAHRQPVAAGGIGVAGRRQARSPARRAAADLAPSRTSGRQQGDPQARRPRERRIPNGDRTAAETAVAVITPPMPLCK